MSLNVVVCVKQVPQVAEMRFDNEARRLVREGVALTVNAYDRRAVTEAVQLREAHGGTVTAITMGPPRARDALLECLAMGADRAVHLLDDAFAGADTLATARALALAIRRQPFDLVLCGRYSVDAETGQVGPEIAELLGIPQVTGLCRLEVDPASGTLRGERETDLGYDEVEAPLPALLTAAERLNKPIRVEPPMEEEARSKPVETLSVADLGGWPGQFGQAGSPTRVAEIIVQAPTRQAIVIGRAPVDQQAGRLLDELERRGALRDSLRRELVSLPLPSASAEVAVLVYAELAGGVVRSAALELLGRGAQLAAELGGRTAALLVGNQVRRLAPDLGPHGADLVLLAEGPELGRFNTEAHAAALAGAIARTQPAVVLLPATANGRDVAPRVAARLGLGLTGDCVGLSLNDGRQLVQLKPAFGGNVLAPILTSTRPQMATVRPGVFPAGRRPAGSPEVVELAAPSLNGARIVQSHFDESVEGLALDEAQRVICVGTGIEAPEFLPEVRRLAAAMDACLCATRKAVDYGWMPRQLQVGLTGRVITPALYVGLGVRGSFNHIIGMQGAGTVVAVNLDPNAEMFAHADVAVVSDVTSFVPALTRAFESPRLNMPPDGRPPEPSLVVGVGCHWGTPSREFAAAIAEALAEVGAKLDEVRNLATSDSKRTEDGLSEYAREHGLQVRYFSTEELKAAGQPPNPSETTRAYAGVVGVAEPAAMLSAGAAELLLPKRKHQNVTVAIARAG